MANLGRLLTRMGRLEEAERLIRGAPERRRATLGGDHPHVASDLHDLGMALRRAGRLAEAEASLGAALELRRRLLGETHPQTVETARALAELKS